jgi:hypothetical protein
MAYTNSIEAIKVALVNSCLDCNPRIFKPYLASEKVNVEDVNKEDFYKFFKYMFQVTKKISEGELILKIEIPDHENPSIQRYCFYDAVHVYPRLTIIFNEEADSVYFDILPF